MKIQSQIKVVVCMVVLCIGVFGMLSVGGCIKTDAETLARIATLEKRLDHVEELLLQAQNQREASTQKLESMSAILMAAQSQIQELIDTKQTAYDALDMKLSETATQRDAATADVEESRAEIEKLNDQLKRQTQEITEFKDLVNNLKGQIADLQEAISPPPEEPIVSVDTERAKAKGPVVGFPEMDPSVIVIRGPSRD